MQNLSIVHRFSTGALFAALVLVAAVAGFLAATFLTPRVSNVLPENMSATVWPEPKPVPAFTLIDHKGQTFNRDRLLGHWNFLFFGYTHCPDVCPTTLALLNGVASKLADKPGSGSLPQFVFISVDPERDTPQRLAEYVPYFNQDFIGVTGDEAHLKGLTTPLGVMYMRAPEQTGTGYLVDHSASILLVDPEGRFHAVFSAPHDLDAIVRDFLVIRQHYDLAS